MEELKKIISQIVATSITKMIISKPVAKSAPYKKIVIERKKEYFQAAKYTEKQVFHDNIIPEDLEKYLQETIADVYLQVNAWDAEKEHILLISKKGKATYKTKKLPNAQGTNPKAKKGQTDEQVPEEIGRASCRERV